ncbi:helix-turn-helix transcriptional regulator [Microbulbifer celer]|nr:metalloregulator ArsR/SmtB family transcription factor [Microbulbifer celer]UFN56527.1 transcriptional regulator [Microbulbifer celer]
MAASSNNRDRILYILKTRGPQTAQVLANELDITPVGTRQHLKQLADDGLLAHFERAEKVGRPASFWQLTEKAHGRFPDRHSDLSLHLIDSVREVFGDEGLEALIAKRERNALSDYQQALAACTSLAGKVKKLAELRNREGYMAQAIHQSHGVWLLVENHCPICAAATKCREFCRSELDIFRQCLPEAEVVRVDYLLEGARRCTYRITP